MICDIALASVPDALRSGFLHESTCLRCFTFEDVPLQNAAPVQECCPVLYWLAMTVISVSPVP